MSDSLRFRIIGLCILAAFPLFGIGQALLDGELHRLGLLMCFSNSAAVILIGFLMRPMIATTAPRSGDIYFISRLAEGTLLGASVTAVQKGFMGLTISGDTFYQLGMIALGLGSLPMCLWLIRSKTVPTMLARLGFVGYLSLIIAMIASAYGFEATSTTLLLSGATFEVIFGVMLIARVRSKQVQGFSH
jgi:hypothetical protein